MEGVFSVIVIAVNSLPSQFRLFHHNWFVFEDTVHSFHWVWYLGAGILMKRQGKFPWPMW